ncbi:MAG TPA: zinc dependent phospholipase C family protein [Dehalococcoidia bacterium]|nr:zinc dependent phospholipase C family protein [Dehalococcoidia bacterium]
MPPLAMHTVIAKEVADKLRERRLEDGRGALYLGSTAPDIRIITRWDRKLTHFFDINDFGEQDGVQAFLAAHPEFAEPSQLQPMTLAFIAGYLTHLAMDETWINYVYRPYFGERSPLRGSLRANVMDRALQFALDRREREDRELVADIVSAMMKAEMGIEIGFIDSETLKRWREVVLQVVNDPPNWERFNRVALRHVKTEAGAENMDELLDDLPGLVEETINYLSQERIKAFLEESAKRSLETVREYLCA